ncbi:MAG: serine/threonine protein kinase, partial [Pirellulaceae bacterium]
MITTRTVIKPKQQLGKYRIECKLGEGGCAAVYRALDTIEGVRVALKVPFQNRINDSWLNEFKREIRINAQLHHPNILPVKNAEILEGLPMVAYPLGERTLADRLRSRISVET